MEQVTYYARLSYEKDGVVDVVFPDVDIGVACGDDREEAIKNAGELLDTMLDMGEDDIDIIYPPSSLEDLEAEADTEKWNYLDGIEIRREFVPITIAPPSNVYLTKIKSHPRDVLAITP